MKKALRFLGNLSGLGIFGGEDLKKNVESENGGKGKVDWFDFIAKFFKVVILFLGMASTYLVATGDFKEASKVNDIKENIIEIQEATEDIENIFKEDTL